MFRLIGGCCRQILVLTNVALFPFGRLGDAWLSLYAEPVDREPIPAHIEHVRNAPGEMITYERREPNWIVVSGYKGNRIFYRRATLACENRQWHHIAFFADRCHVAIFERCDAKEKTLRGGKRRVSLIDGVRAVAFPSSVGTRSDQLDNTAAEF